MGSIRPRGLEAIRSDYPLMFNPTKLQDFVNSVENRHEAQFNRLIDRLDIIIELLNKEYQYMATIQNVTDAIAAESTVDDSIVTLLNGIVQQLKDAQAAGTPAALDAVVAGIQANQAKISAAVVANTPAAPVTPVVVA